MSRFSRADRSFLGQWWWTVDRPLLFAFLLLMVIGIILVATASPPVAEHLGLGSFHFLIRHIVVLIPALALFFGFSMCDPRTIWRISSIIFVCGIFAMVLVLFVGIEIKGARRWIHLPGFSLQPSEFIKPSFIIVSAWLMALQKIKEKFPGKFLTVVLYTIVAFLLLMQPDFGMTFVVTIGLMTIFFIFGLRFRMLFILVALGVIGATFAYLSFDHVQSRVNRFLDPESGDNYQVERSLEAFQTGGIMGTGPGQGVVKLGLPDAHADFIFSVAGEEMGLIAILIIVFIYGFIIIRGLGKMNANDDLFSVLAAGGLLTIFSFQAFVHMGSAMNLLPAKGMTLPFMSYGGSSLLSTAYAMGVVLALTRRTKRPGISKGGLSM